MIHILPQVFPLGRLRITPKAQRLLNMTKESAWTYLFLHGSCSWVSEEDKQQVEDAVAHDAAIVSFHAVANSARIAVRTNDGHTQTIITLAEETP